jgi:branched-subunit amino acid aminotransferase/4-amino-4-deoxychorismate lyase
VHLNGTRTRLGVSSWRRNPADSLPPLKLCGAYVNSILAKREAKARGFDEAMFTDAAATWSSAPAPTCSWSATARRRGRASAMRCRGSPATA